MWPWGMHEKDCVRCVVSGCEVGLVSSKGKFMCKKWAFQVAGSAALVAALERLRCSHSERHQWAAGGSACKRTEDYTIKLGAILVLGGLR